jgi:hypothetical protein
MLAGSFIGIREEALLLARNVNVDTKLLRENLV